MTSDVLAIALAVLKRLVLAGLWLLPVVLIFVLLPVLAQRVFHLDRSAQDAVGVVSAVAMAATIGLLAFGRGRGRLGRAIQRWQDRLPRALSRRPPRR